MDAQQQQNKVTDGYCKKTEWYDGEVVLMETANDSLPSLLHEPGEEMEQEEMVQEGKNEANGHRTKEADAIAREFQLEYDL
jgi:hypothetical protein